MQYAFRMIECPIAKEGAAVSSYRNLQNEIVGEVAESARMSPTFLVFMASSGVLSSVALLTNSIPVLLGAMVIAPVMAPLQLVAFGLVGGQWRMALRGFYTVTVGLTLAVLCTFLTAWFLVKAGVIGDLRSDSFLALLDERVRPGIFNVIVALAAGISGTLAMAQKKIDTLVGVVSAVALVPAAGAGALSLMAGDLPKALGGFSLFAINFLLIIGIAIITLTLFGRYLEVIRSRE